MSVALKLAKRGRFFTSPNPLCGAVIVKKGKIIGKGFHKRFGGKHAEISAIEGVQNKRELKGATLYCNLEPCSHYGKTPPCTERIIKEGISEVVIAQRDPNPLVKGIEELKAAGIKVRTGIMEKEAKELNEWFIKYIKKKIPYVTVKVAATLDGKIADSGGESKWITSKQARDSANLLRCEQDCVIVGIDTILKDDPKLTCRSKKKEVKRVILDTSLRINLKSRLFSEPGEIIIFTGMSASDKKRRRRLEEMGVRVIPVQEEKGLLSWRDILRKLYQLGVAKVLIEGGARVISSALKEGIVDKFLIFFSPKILGKGISFSCRLSLPLRKSIKLKDTSLRKIGEDFLFTGYVHRYY